MTSSSLLSPVNYHTRAHTQNGDINANRKTTIYLVPKNVYHLELFLREKTSIGIHTCHIPS